jgi:hypothetical protein
MYYCLEEDNFGIGSKWDRLDKSNIIQLIQDPVKIQK